MAQGYRVIMKKNLSGKEGEPEQKEYAIPKYNGNTDMGKIMRFMAFISLHLKQHSESQSASLIHQFLLRYKTLQFQEE